MFSDDHGDWPRPLPDIKELKSATDITERKESPFWDYDVSLCVEVHQHVLYPPTLCLPFSTIISI